MQHHSISNSGRRCRSICYQATGLGVLFCILIQPAMAQDTTGKEARRGGLQIRTVSGYFDYYSAGLSNSTSFQPSVTLPADAAVGASVQAGWSKFGERSNSFFAYTSSLTGRVRYSEWNAWNHALSLTTSHKITPRWLWGFSGGGDISTQEQSLFAPTTLSGIAAAPASFDDLAAAMLASKFSNAQLQSVFAGAPLADSPVRNLLYGQRMFTSGVQTSLSYSYSPRLSVTFNGGAGRSQHISEGRSGDSRNVYLLPNTTSGSAGVTVSYALSPRTQLGGTLTTSRIVSGLQDAYTTNSIVKLGWKAGRRWLLQVQGGMGVLKPVRQTLMVSTTPLPAGGGSVAYKTYSQTFMASFDRAVSDAYGLGAGTTTSAGGSWRWSRPGRDWWLESSAGWQQLRGNGVGDTSGWRTSAGWGRNLGRQVVLLTQYVYLSYSGKLQNTHYAQDQSGARLSLVWSPNR
jgi:hypothetical protein